jgi:hypothetical protein
MRRIVAFVWIVATAACVFGHADQPEAVRVTEEQLWQALDLERPGLEKLKAAVARGDREVAAGAWAEHFRARTGPTCHFDRDRWPGYLRHQFPAVAEAMLRDAERVAGGDISHGTIRLPVEGTAPHGKIEWLHNPKRDTNYVSLVGSQWFMNPLGRAYLLSGDERFAETFAWVFESWFDHQEAICEFQGGLGFDPVYRAYYPGIQSRILVDNYYAMARSPALTPAVHVKVMRQLLACARFLERQERHYRKGNQQVGAVVGLGIVGLVFPEFNEAAVWVERAETIMAGHLHQDFFADGGHRELCTQYHKTCLRDISYVALTSEHNVRPSPLLRGENGKALEKAYDWLARLVMPTGETPPLHSAVFSTDHAVYGLISAIHFQRPDHAYLASRFWERGEAPSQKAPLAYAVYLLSSSLETSALRNARPPEYKSTHLGPSGFGVMRTGWGPEDRYLVFQYGWANTGHAYPVALSFLLQMNGELIATHPGSPRSYRHPAYRYCHSTMSHQTVSIDGKSYPNVKGVAPGGRLECCAALPGLWYVSAHHQGYKESIGAVHRRQIVALEEGPILIVDQVEGGRGHTAQWNFHTPLSVTVGPDRSVTLRGKHTYRLAPAHPGDLTDVKTHNHWSAVLPRDCQPDDCGAEVVGLVLEKPIEAHGARFAVALFEGDGDIREEPTGVFRLSGPEEQYLVLSGSQEAICDDHRIQAEGRLTVIRFAQRRPARAWVVEGTKLAVNQQTLMAADQPATKEIGVEL